MRLTNGRLSRKLYALHLHIFIKIIQRVQRKIFQIINHPINSAFNSLEPEKLLMRKSFEEVVVLGICLLNEVNKNKYFYARFISGNLYMN